LALAEPIPVGTNPISVAYYREKNVALVANYLSNSVSVIDMQNKARIRDITVGLGGVGNRGAMLDLGQHIRHIHCALIVVLEGELVSAGEGAAGT